MNEDLKTKYFFFLIMSHYHIHCQGGIDSGLPNGGVYIKSLQFDGSAELDARINIGDRLLEVNGIGLENVSHKQVDNFISALVTF